MATISQGILTTVSIRETGQNRRLLTESVCSTGGPGGKGMKRLAVVVGAVGFAISSIGCQCCGLHEPYEDLIDAVSEPAVRFDPLYVPGWDVTRIGHSDWCQKRMNRLFCHRACAETFLGDETAGEGPRRLTCENCDQPSCLDGCQNDIVEPGSAGE